MRTGGRPFTLLNRGTLDISRAHRRPNPDPDPYPYPNPCPKPNVRQDKEQVKDMFVDYKKLEIKGKQDTDVLAPAQQALDTALAELKDAEAALASAPLVQPQPQPQPSTPMDGAPRQSLPTDSSSAVSAVTSAEVEEEKRKRMVAEETAKRMEADRDNLRGAIFQLQEAMQKMDTTGQVEELVKQIRVAQESNKTAETKIKELQEGLEKSKGEVLAFKQEIRRTKKLADEAEKRARVSGWGWGWGWAQQLVQTRAAHIDEFD